MFLFLCLSSQAQSHNHDIIVTVYILAIADMDYWYGLENSLKCTYKSSISLFLLFFFFVFPADVPSMPASCDRFAVSLWPLHRTGGKTIEKRGVISGAESAGAVDQFQTHTVQLPKT